MKRPWLAPLVPLYAAGAALRDLRIRNGWETVRQLQWPVISVGNLSTGGAGKTPFAIALAKLMTRRGLHVDVLSRGYGRVSHEPVRVRVDGTAAEFGDEPLLIARDAGVPVYVARQRYDAGLLAEADLAGQHEAEAHRKPSVHILDDGFQHRQLARNVDILLLGESDLRDSLLPAGNLRESLRAMGRANVIALPADERELEAMMRRTGWEGQIWTFHRRMEVPAVDGPVIAFCGIARPEQFFAGLEAAGLQCASKLIFRDHHPYTPQDMDRLAKAAQSAGARAFVTTEKDLVRLANLADALPAGVPLKTAAMRIEIEEADVAVEWLAERLAANSAQRAL
jgi:tetraacyldisaccharide 4'-kinase